MSKMRLQAGSRQRAGRVIGTAAALALSAILCGCGATVGSMPLIGEPARTPAAPAVTADYPLVSEPATKRTTTPLTAAERATFEADLVKDRAQAAQEKRDQINRSSAR